MPTSLAFISSWLNAWLPDISLIKSALYTNETHPCVYCHLPNGASSGVLRVALRCVASLFISSFVSSFTTRSLSVCMETNWIQVESTNMNKQSESRVYWTMICAAPLINKYHLFKLFSSICVSIHVVALGLKVSETRLFRLDRHWSRIYILRGDSL